MALSTRSSSRRSWALRTVSSLLQRQKNARLRRKQAHRAPAEQLEDRALLATFVVTNTNDAGAGSLRDAIDQANNTIAADNIVFNIPGANPTITLENGEFQIDEELIIDGTNATGGFVTIDGNNNSRLFDTSGASGLPVEFRSLTMQNGRATFDGAADQTGQGGAVFNIDATLTLTDVTLEGNQADIDGGAIFNSGGTLTLQTTFFQDNSSGENGGAINSIQASVNILDTGFLSNSASDGGAVAYDGAAAQALSIVRTTFSTNSATTTGGAVRTNAVASVLDSTFVDNDAPAGGGIFNDGVFQSLNSTFSANTAATAGGAILNDGRATVTNSTLTQNTGRGIWNVNANTSDLFLFNSLVAGNPEGDLGGRAADPGSSFNLIGDPLTSGFLFNGVQGNIVGDGGGNALDPDTVVSPNLANNGGSTFTHKIVTDGLAHNAGDDNRAAFAGPDGIPDISAGDLQIFNDQRGSDPFVRIFGDAVDIGAFEIQPLIVDIRLDESDGNFVPGDFSLREALELAATGDGDTVIAFNIPELSPVITIGDQLTITNEIKIDGRNLSGEGGFISIDGDSTGRIFFVDGPTAVDNGLPEPILTLQNLTLQNGHADGSDPDVMNSGGASLDLDGGAILNQMGTVEIINSGVFSNTADGSGGAVMNTDGGRTVVVNSTIGENSALITGAAISNQSGIVSAVNATITGNNAGVSGGGIHTELAGAQTLVNNSIVAGNFTSTTPQDFSGAFVEPGASHNIVGSSASPGGIVNGVDGNIVGNNGLGTIDIATVLDTVPDNNGGAALSYALIDGSPALDAGDNNLAALPGDDFVPDISGGDEALISDTRDFPFERIYNGTTDIGSYEDQFLDLPVSTTVDELDSDFSDGDFSMREALRFSNLNPRQDLIQFNIPGGGPFVEVEDQLLVTRSLIIDGSNQSGGTVTLLGDNNGRVMEIDGTTRSVTADISNIIFSGGNANGDDGGLIPSSGGALLNRFATVNLTNTVVEDNEAADSGGGIYNEEGVLTLNNVSIRNNEAGILGGGIANDDGTVDVITSTLSGNHSASDGGAIFNNNGPLSVVNSTISSNSSNLDAGGIYNEDDTVAIVNSTIVNNVADADANGTGVGGGLYTVDDAVTFTNAFNNIFAGNTVGGGTAADIAGKALEAASSNNIVADADSAVGLVDGVNGNIVGDGGTGTMALDVIVDPTLSDNGGFSQTHALALNSPAIDQGDTNRAAIPGANSIPDVAGDGDTVIVNDQRGFPFVRAFGPVDIGAYEVTQKWVVDVDVDIDNGDFSAGDLSLREAIRLANTTPAPVVIEFDIPGGDPIITLIGEELLVTSSVVIDGDNAGRGFVTLDGDSSGRIMKVDALLGSATVGITNITLTNGIADGSDDAPFNNEGGAIFNQSGDLWISNSTIIGNSAVESGGGVMSRAGTTTIWDTTFEANTAENGGGFFNFGSSTTIRDTTFSSNNATLAGGGILARTGDISVISSTFTGNTADTGAAGANEIGADTFITNSTVSGNQAGLNGGAFENESGFLVVTNSTITGNIADADDDGNGSGGGIWTSASGGTRLFNSIVAGNEIEDPVFPGQLPNDLGGTNVVPVSSNNLIGDPNSAAGMLDGNNGNIVGNAGVVIDITTVLDPVLAFNGGSTTLSHRLVPGSPAIDAGDSNRAALPGADGLPNISADGDEALLFDQRDSPFVRTTGNVDIGSYEVTNSWVVTSSDDLVDGVLSVGSYSLREAIEAANVNPGPDVLTFDISLAGIDIDLSGSPLVITEALTINGLGAASTTINAGGLDRIMHVAPGVIANVSHMTLTGGSTTDGGGAIYSEGEVHIADTIFDSNTADHGGALFVEGVASVRRSLFTNNTAVYGGAIASDASQLNVYIENTTISGNTATGVSGTMAGAGIHISDAAFTIVNSTVANNTSAADAEGAGVAIDFNNNGSLRMVNSIVADNNTGHPNVDISGELELSHSLVEVNLGYLIRGNSIANLNGDPGLAPLALNHGQIPTHELTPGSEAINAGDDTEVTFATDQTGQPRQVRSVDMGAAETLLVAFDDFASTLITDPVSINVTNNDNPSTDLAVTRLVSDPARGTAIINGGSIDYTPDQSFAPGQDTFFYEVGVETQTVETSIGGIRLGHSVAVDGDWMVSGALEFDDNGVADVGAAYVYRRSGASWILFDTITPDDGAVLDQFGYSVGIDGTTIVVGSRKADAMGANSGAVYVYEFDANQGLWLQSAKLVDTVDGSAGDQFGHAVAIQGDTIVVGARFDDGGGTNSGSISVFNRTTGGWTSTGRILTSDGAKGDQFGYSIAIDGDTIVAGARKDNLTAVRSSGPKDIVDTGSVYVFENVAGTWTETANISNPDLRRNNWFGHSVDISGDNIAVGMPGRFTRFRTGEAFVFNRNTGGADAWGNVAQIVDQSVDSQTDRFGVSVAIDGETLVIGAEWDDTQRNDSGKVYIHGQNISGPNAWGFESERLSSTPRENGGYGHAVAIDGTTVAIGAPAINTRIGRVHVEDLRRETGEVIVLISAPLRASEAGAGAAATLNEAQLGPIVEAATQYWLNTPLTAAQQMALANVDISVGSLDGLLLGTGSSRSVVIDDDAAGHGWYVDPTPFDQTDDNIGDRMDLLSAVTHELGHVIGHRDTYDANRSDDMMYGFLNAGESKLAGPAESLDMVFGQMSDLKDDLFAL